MRFGLAALILLVMPSSYGQSSQPNAASMRAESRRITEIIEITHCLKVGVEDIDWLGDSAALEKAKILQVGLRHDRKTYPGKDVIFLVVFESRIKGDVFELTREDHKASRSYRIENNGSFRAGRGGFEWPGEILGGIWTHEYIERNVRRIMRGPKTPVPIRTALKPMTHLTCSYYGSD